MKAIKHIEALKVAQFEGHTGAIYTLEHAAELAPEAIETRVAAGYIAYRGFRDYDAALTEFLAAEEMGGDDPDIAGAVGNIYRRQGQLTEAIARYERRVELDSTHRRGFATLAQTYTSDGQYDGVMRAAQQLVSMDDRRGQYWRFWAHLHSGDTASAFAVVPDIKRAEGSEGQPGYFEVIRAVMRREDATLSALVDSIGLNVTGGYAESSSTICGEPGKSRAAAKPSMSTPSETSSIHHGFKTGWAKSI